MRTPVDDEFCAEVARYRLRFTCEDCAHFAPERSACAHGYPVEAHHAVDLTSRRTLEFCKDFELC